MSYFGEYQTDVVYDLGFASELVCNLRWMARKIDDYEVSRAGAERTASEGFEGAFSQVFANNMHHARIDGMNLSFVLGIVADRIDYLIHEVIKENKRRAHIRNYMAEHDDWWSSIWDWFAGTTIPPFPTEILPEKPGQQLVVLHVRDHSRTGSIAKMGISSAYPARLRSAATVIHAACDRVTGVEALIADLHEYPSRCQYGSVDIADLPQNLRRWLEDNHADAQWLNVVAQAFEEAGGSGDFPVSLSDVALLAALEAQGIALARTPLDITAPTLAGIDPASGYVLDPVNAATGSFIEPEMDLGFTGGCTSLAFTRMYNSLGGGSGVFGPNWTSVLDQQLCLKEEQARWVRDDGRHILFPRCGRGFERAAQDHYWCDRLPVDQVPDFVRDFMPAHDDECFIVSDNQGAYWFYDRRGAWLGSGAGEGTHVRVQRGEDGMIHALVHERGRSITCKYADGLCVKVQASDGRELTYLYDDDSRLIGVRSRQGERRYVVGEQGLIEQVFSVDGVREVTNTYDEVGRVVSQVTDFGREVRFSYLPGGVTEVADQSGARANAWISNAQGRLVGVIDADGNRQSMSYDNCGNLVAATGRDGQVTVHVYDQRGRRTRTVLPTGGEFTFAWDEHDRLSTMVTGSGGQVSYLYDTDTQRHPSVIVDPLGGQTSLTWDQGLLCRIVDPTGVSVSLGYDVFGDLVSVTNDQGVCARFVRDEAGRVCQAVAPDGAVTRLEYDERGHCVAVEHPDGARWSYEFEGSRLVATVDPYGARTSATYGKHGQPVSVTDPLGRTTRRVFDDCGNVESLLLPDGAEYSFVHDALSRLRELRTPDGGLWRHEWNEMGNLVRATDPTGVSQRWVHAPASSPANAVGASGVTADSDVAGPANSADQKTPDYGVEFDQYGRPTRWSGPAGDEGIVTYDLGGNPVEFLDADGGLTLFRRDLAGRVVERISPEGVSVRYTYDACGRVQGVHDAAGTTRFEYDICSRVTKRISPTGEESCFSYDPVGRLVEASIPGVGRSQYRYDLCGRVVFSREPLTGVRRFSYDHAGQLVRAVNGVGGATRYEYDAAGRLLTVTDPAGGVTRREYDVAGRLVALTDPLGNATQATYDAAGRLVTQTGPDGVELSFEYNAAGERVATYANGKLLTRVERDLVARTVRLLDHTHPDGRATAHELAFDHAGRLVARTRERAGQVMVARWEYDRDGRRRAFIDADGARTTYTYDEVGRLTCVEHPSLGRVDLAYDEAGRVVRADTCEGSRRWLYDGGWLAAHWQDEAGAIGEDRATGEGDAAGGSAQVSYDMWGRVSRVEDAGITYAYAYDDAHQLCEVRSSAGTVNQWEYDQAGRLIRSVCDGVETDFVYDEASQLTRTTSGGDSTVYAYDQRGRRISAESASGERVHYAWDARNWLTEVTEHRAGGSPVTHRLWIDGVGELSSVDDVALTWDSASLYPSLTGVNGAPLMHMPGGGIRVGSSQVECQAECSGGASWRTTRWHDPANPWMAPALGGLPGVMGLQISSTGTPVVAGLEWMGARPYDPATSHFLSRDPLPPLAGSSWEANPYNYAANNPLNTTDPLGLRPVTDAQLNAYNNYYGLGFLGEAKQWFDTYGAYIFGTLAIVVGVALLLTGVGGPAGIALLAASGALIGGGSSALVQKYENGFVDPTELAIDTLIGGVGGLAGGGAAAGVAKMGGGLVARKTAEVTVGNLAQPIGDMIFRKQSFQQAGLNYLTSTTTGMAGAKINRVLVGNHHVPRLVADVGIGATQGALDAATAYGIESYFPPTDENALKSFDNRSLGFRMLVSGATGAGGSIDRQTLLHPHLSPTAPHVEGSYLPEVPKGGRHPFPTDNHVYRYGDIRSLNAHDIYSLDGTREGIPGSYQVTIKYEREEPVVTSRHFLPDPQNP